MFFFVQYCEEVTKAFSASPNSHTIDSVIKDIRWPVEIVLIETNDGKFCRVTVSPKSPIAVFLVLSSFRSGFPEYIFNTQGILIDSTLDYQDDSRYQAQWANAVKIGPITQKEFLAMAKEK